MGTTSILRFLSVCHFAWGGALLLVAGWSLASLPRVMEEVSGGMAWSLVPGFALWAVVNALPVVALGTWLILLGRRLWSPGARLRTALLWTHGSLLVVGALAVAAGIQGIGAAELSAARGGGLLGPVAWLPLLFGVPMAALSSLSLAVAVVLLPGAPGAEQAPEGPPHAPRGGRAAALLLGLFLLLAGGIALLFRAAWPPPSGLESAQDANGVPVPRGEEAAALRALSKRPPGDAAAFLRSAVMNGRLGAMKAAAPEETLALLASNIPAAFDCLDELARDSDRVMARIGKQAGPRTREDGRLDDEYLRLLNSTNDLVSALREVRTVPAGLQSFLEERASRKGAGQPLAIDLMGRLDIPAERRAWLLLAYVRGKDAEAANAALQALARMGAQAQPALAELKRLEAEYWKDPATAALSHSVGRASGAIQERARQEASRPSQEASRPSQEASRPSQEAAARPESAARQEEAPARRGEPMFLVFLDEQNRPEVVEIADASPGLILVEPGLGVWQPAFFLQWSAPGADGPLRAEQQMEISMSLSGEGPHLDLVDWKRHYTAWKELKPLGSGRWRSAEFAREELASFPPFTVQEVKDEVRRLLKDDPGSLQHWLARAETCGPPFDRACALLPSRAVIRISKRDGAGWSEIKRIEILIPMGC